MTVSASEIAASVTGAGIVTAAEEIETAAAEEVARVEEDVDSLPPPPADDGFEENRNPLLTAPKPARKGHNQDVLVSSQSLTQSLTALSFSHKSISSILVKNL